VVNNLFPQFLIDPQQYGLSERFWVDLWDQIAPFERARYEWSRPWLGTGSSDIRDGNPIFSAYSPVLGRGVRVIQEEPIGCELDIRVWLDTFGGDIVETDRTHELVISCALSAVASEIARSLISSWVQGHSISFRHNESGLLLPSDSEDPSRKIMSLGNAA
jgi:hypothetical protein